MDEGFPAGRPGVERRDRGAHARHSALAPEPVACAERRGPTRSIPNRVVKRGSVEGTGG